MRAREFIKGYINPSKMTARFRRELEDALDREGPPADTALIRAMYADEEFELDLEQKRLEIQSSRAEIEKMRASAYRDRAEALDLRIQSGC